ncbi:MAG: HAD family hydrolase [Anaerolineae bacterium]
MIGASNVGDSPTLVSQSLPHLKAILLDLDGTLIETDNRWVALLAGKLAWLERISPNVNVQAWARRLVMAIETPANYVMSLLEHLGIGSGFLGLADRVRRAKGVATRDSSELVPGSRYLLSELKGRLKLAVVTTRAHPEAVAFVEQAGLGDCFQAIVTRQDVLRMKPHPEPIQKAAALLGVSPEACAMVGDTTADVKAAKRAGAFAVAVLSGFGLHAELERAGADLILPRAELLLDYLDL